MIGPIPCGAVMTGAALLKPLRPAGAQRETRPISASDQHVVFLEFRIMRPYELFRRAHTGSDFMRARGSNQSAACALVLLLHLF